MDMDLEDKVAVVTGGTRGIGRAIAEALLEEGAKVFLCGRDPSNVQSAIEKLRSRWGDRAAGAAADVRRHEECRKLIQSAADCFGGIDILVNNAGIGIFKPVEKLAPEEWDDTIQTNLSGVFYCTHEAIPFLRGRGGGYIFNISSLAGINTFPEGAAYSASKFGLNGFSEALMQEVRYDGIRVSYILPGSVATEFGSPGRPKAEDSWKVAAEDVAKAVVDLCRFPERTIASRVEIRPSRPPRKK
jgi:NAD(P)-dependent dehydrogenase (short-subunit alcohol dehydrogenase family)